MRRLSFSTRLLLALCLPVVVTAGATALALAWPGRGLPTPLAVLLGSALGAATALWTHARLRAPLAALRDRARALLGTAFPHDDDDVALLDQALTSLSGRAQEQVGALEAERQHLLAIVSSMSEGVLVVDRAGTAVLANPYWRDLFGLAGDVEGGSAIELTRQTRLERLIHRTLETGVGGQEEIDLDLPRARNVVVTCSALSDRSGAVVVARDITAFLRLAEIRRDFVANVSHELKTPLSAIRGLAETLHDGALDDPPAADRFLTRILRQCERLEALLADLLTLSRLEHPAAAGDRQPVDLGVVVRDAAEVLTAMAKQKNVRLELLLEPVETIAADRETLDQLVLNLLENAIKYNRPGGRVEALLEAASDGVVLRVTDTGIGIPSDSLDRLFERFYRVDKGRSREEGGTGLGLAIVKHATQRLGGQVTVSSRLGVGTTVQVELPRRPATGAVVDGPVAGL